MGIDTYPANEEVRDLVEEIKSGYHTMLSECGVTIGVDFVVRDDDKDLPVIAKDRYPVPAVMRVTPLRYRKRRCPDAVLELDKSWWDTLDADQKAGLVHQELCRIEVALDEDGQPVLDKADRPKLVRRAPNLIVEVFDEVLGQYGEKSPCYGGLLDAQTKLSRVGDTA